MKAAVILSGCGHRDGAEIREAVLTLLYLDQNGVEAQCFAPDAKQHDVVNHATGETATESRNSMAEAARIARGKIEPLSALKAGDYAMLLIPGGYGAAKNLSDLALKGAEAAVIPEFQQAVLGFLEQKKPIGAICIAPAVLAAAVKGKYSLTLTIGDDEGTAGAINALGSQHQNCPTDGFVWDEAHRVASCSAYMHEAPLAQIARGIEQVVGKVVGAAKAIQGRQAA